MYIYKHANNRIGTSVTYFTDTTKNAGIGLIQIPELVQPSIPGKDKCFISLFISLCNKFT